MSYWPHRPGSHYAVRPGLRAGRRGPARRRRVRPPHGTRAPWWLVLLLVSLLLGWFLMLGWPGRWLAGLTWLLLALHQRGWLLLGAALVLVLALVGIFITRLRSGSRRLVRLYLQQQSLRALQAMDPLAFEQYVGKLFEREGYQVTFTPHSGDEGIDLWLTRPARRRRLGVVLAWSAGMNALVGGGPPRIPVQCKRYAADHAVGSPELHAFSGALRGALAEEGYFVTTSRFTPAAEAWAAKEGIHLIDGPALVCMARRLLPSGHLA